MSEIVNDYVTPPKDEEVGSSAKQLKRLEEEDMLDSMEEAMAVEQIWFFIIDLCAEQ